MSPIIINWSALGTCGMAFIACAFNAFVSGGKRRWIYFCTALTLGGLCLGYIFLISGELVESLVPFTLRIVGIGLFICISAFGLYDILRWWWGRKNDA